MLRTVHLHGSLATRFGEKFVLDVATPAEAVRALGAQLRGFEQEIRAGEWRCVRGDFDSGLDCDEELIKLNFGHVTDFHLMPAAYGEKKKGIGKTILGIVLMITALVIAPFAPPDLTYAVFMAGVSLTFSGIAMMLSPMPKPPTDVDQRAGFLFNGAANTSSQGGACPLVFGRIRAGSVVVSAGFSTDRMEHANSAGDMYTSGGTVLGTVVNAVLVKNSQQYYTEELWP